MMVVIKESIIYLLKELVKDKIINNYPTYGNIKNFVEERSNSRNGTVSLLFGFTYLFHRPDYHRTRFQNIINDE